MLKSPRVMAREQLRALAVSLWEKRAVEWTAAGRLPEAIKAWEARINLKLWREEPHRQLSGSQIFYEKNVRRFSQIRERNL